MPRTTKSSDTVSPTPAPARRRRLDPLLALLLLAALALRVWGIGERVPDPTVADVPMEDTAVDEGDRRAVKYAWEMWYGGAKPLDLNPGTGDWPGLPFYLTLATQAVVRAYDATRHPGSSPESFVRRVDERPGSLFLAGRALGVALGVASVFLTYLLGTRVGGRRAGLVAAAFLTFLPFHVFSSQRVVDPNLLSLLFMTVATIFLLRGIETERLRDSVVAGAAIGLAGASKYLPLGLLASLVLAHVTPRFAIRFRGILAGSVAAAIAFALASPYTILDWTVKQRDIRVQQLRHFAEWVGQSSRSVALPDYFTHVLPEMMTWACFLIAIAGCFLVWRKGRVGHVLVSVAVVVIIGVGILGVAQPRFVFPIVGTLAVTLGVAVSWGCDQLGGRLAPRLRIREGRLENGLAALFVSGLAVWGVADAATTRAAFAKPDSRHVAYAWVLRSIDPNAMLALDSYGPVLRRGGEGRRALLWPFYASLGDVVRSAYRPAWLDGVRFYMTSSEVTRRFQVDDARYAQERAFYAWIRSNGRRVWGTDPTATFGPRLDLYVLPPVISSRAERDSLWSAELETRAQGGRIATWAAQLAQDFLLSGDFARAEEWAVRGLELGDAVTEQLLLETLAIAQLQSGNPAGAERTARSGFAKHPDSSLLALFHAMALEAMGRAGDALEAYRKALPLSPNANARRMVQASIARLERTAPGRG
jgi:hypothetical protein